MLLKLLPVAAGAVFVLFSTSDLAFAKTCEKGGKSDKKQCQSAAQVPEINTLAGGSAVAFLLAGLALSWERRRKAL